MSDSIKLRSTKDTIVWKIFYVHACVINFHTCCSRWANPGERQRANPIKTLIPLLGCVLLLVSAAGLRAQSTSTLPLKWGKLTAEEIQLKTCAFDTGAAAIVLSDYGRIIFGYEAVYIERHKRIKILNRKG